MMNTVGTFKMTMMILVSKMMILQKYLDIVEMVLTAHRIVEIWENFHYQDDLFMIIW